jgi:hypothetical protein
MSDERTINIELGQLWDADDFGQFLVGALKEISLDIAKPVAMRAKTNDVICCDGCGLQDVEVRHAKIVFDEGKPYFCKMLVCRDCELVALRDFA